MGALPSSLPPPTSQGRPRGVRAGLLPREPAVRGVRGDEDLPYILQHLGEDNMITARTTATATSPRSRSWSSCCADGKTCRRRCWRRSSPTTPPACMGSRASRPSLADTYPCVAVCDMARVRAQSRQERQERTLPKSRSRPLKRLAKWPLRWVWLPSTRVSTASWTASRRSDSCMPFRPSGSARLGSSRRPRRCSSMRLGHPAISASTPL